MGLTHLDEDGASDLIEREWAPKKQPPQCARKAPSVAWATSLLILSLEAWRRAELARSNRSTPERKTGYATHVAKYKSFATIPERVEP